jgi:hypothetical protein
MMNWSEVIKIEVNHWTFIFTLYYDTNDNIPLGTIRMIVIDEDFGASVKEKAINKFLKLRGVPDRTEK